MKLSRDAIWCIFHLLSISLANNHVIYAAHFGFEVTHDRSFFIPRILLALIINKSSALQMAQFIYLYNIQVLIVLACCKAFSIFYHVCGSSAVSASYFCFRWTKLGSLSGVRVLSSQHQCLCHLTQTSLGLQKSVKRKSL